MKHPNKKTMKKIHVWVRAVIQLLYFLFIPSAYTAAFNGVKYIFTQMGAKTHLEVTSFVAALIVLCVYTVVFGRFFCGFACAFGSLGDAVRALYVFICKKLKKKPITMKATVVKKLQVVKYFVLAIIAVTCFTGVYSKAKGFHAACAQFQIGRLYPWRGTSGADRYWHVLSGTVFLPCSVPDGSSIFCSAGIAVFYPAQRPV